MTEKITVRATATANLDVMQHAKHYNQCMADLVLKELNLPSRNAELTRTVLDFGAGYGTFLHLLQSETRGKPLQWYAVEPEITILTVPKETQMLSSLVGIPDRSMDCVYSLNVFEHIKEGNAVFRQLLEKLTSSLALKGKDSCCQRVMSDPGRYALPRSVM